MNSFELKYSYDYEHDLIYMVIKKKFNYRESIDLDYGIILDFDENYIPVAFEIFSPSKRFNVDKKYLIDPEIEVYISANNDLIRTEIKFTFTNHSKTEVVSIKNKIANNYNTPKMETVLAKI